MRIKNKKRTFGIGIVVWLLFFGWWVRGAFLRTWHFDLFSFSDWYFALTRFSSQRLTDWILIILFIVSGPIFTLLWYLATKIHWRRTFKKILRGLNKLLSKLGLSIGKKQVLYPVVKPTAQTHQNSYQRPVKLTSFSNGGQVLGTMKKTPAFTMSGQNWSVGGKPAAMTPVSPEPSKTPEAFPTNTPYFSTGEPSFNDIAEMPLSEVQLPKTEAVNENIFELMSGVGYQVFESVRYAEQKIDWLAVPKKQILLAVYDDETGDWLADEEACNDEDPLWFSETDHRTSPVFLLQQIKKDLLQKIQTMGLTLGVQPVLIERRGNLINAEDMLKTWNDLGVIVCRTDVGGPVELPVVAEVMKDQQEPVSAEVMEQLHSLFKWGEDHVGSSV